MPRLAVLLILLVPIGIFTPALAAPPAPVQAGHDLAQKYCVECHVITPSASQGWTNAPPFTVIAGNPANTRARLTTFIEKPHMHMLNTGRPAPEAAAIAAYITSLKGK